MESPTHVSGETILEQPTLSYIPVELYFKEKENILWASGLKIKSGIRKENQVVIRFLNSSTQSKTRMKWYFNKPKGGKYQPSVVYTVIFKHQDWKHSIKYLRTQEYFTQEPVLKNLIEEFPGGLVVRIWHFHCHRHGSIPGLGTDLPHQAAAHCSQKKNLMGGQVSSNQVITGNLWQKGWYDCYWELFISKSKMKMEIIVCKCLHM